MRLVFSGIFVTVGLLLGAIILSDIFGSNLPTWAASLIMFVAFVLLLMLALRIFNWEHVSGESIESLREKGLLQEEAFNATRAFEVEESEDEGLHYFIELTDGRALFLSGQYLYEHEEINDDLDQNQPRRFPCTEFTVWQRIREGWVVKVECRGTVLEPEILAPPFSDEWLTKNEFPGDGTIFTDKSYDDLKRELSIMP